MWGRSHYPITIVIETETMKSSDGFLYSPLFDPIATAVLAILVGALAYITNRRYERGRLHHTEMVYLERLSNTYLDSLRLAENTIERYIKTVQLSRVFFLSFQELPLRYEGSINLLDLELMNDWFSIHIGINCLNHDYKNLMRWNDEMSGMLVQTRHLQDYQANVENIVKTIQSELLPGIKDLRQEIKIFLAKDRIKLAKWGRSFWREVFNTLRQPLIPTTKEEIETELKKLENEIQEIQNGKI